MSPVWFSSKVKQLLFQLEYLFPLHVHAGYILGVLRGIVAVTLNVGSVARNSSLVMLLGLWVHLIVGKLSILCEFHVGE
jgi:hypothetical protein